MYCQVTLLQTNEVTGLLVYGGSSVKRGLVWALGAGVRVQIFCLLGLCEPRWASALRWAPESSPWPLPAPHGVDAPNAVQPMT